MSIRYVHRVDGVTSKSLSAVDLHLSRLGKITKIRGYRIMKKNIRAKFEYVMVTGENGTARFGGFCWGYFGEGPRGLIKLLTKCGVESEIAETIAFHTERKDEIGTDWLINL